MESAEEPAFRRLSAAVGAVVEGVDLSARLSQETLAFVRQSLLDRGVLFFREQTPSVQQLWDFLSHFGTPQLEDSFGSDADRPEQVEEADFQPTKAGTAVWHTDSSFLARPPTFTLLRMLKQPPVGGDTCWASTVAAYEALSAPVRRMIEGLSAVHSFEVPADAPGRLRRGVRGRLRHPPRAPADPPGGAPPPGDRTQGALRGRVVHDAQSWS